MITMYCPECKGEFRDGFTSCNKCGVDLVDELPSPETDVRKEQTIGNKILAFKIEDYLKYGGMIYIGIALLREGVKFILTVVQNQGLQELTGGYLINLIFATIVVMLKETLWGLFYIGFSQIITFLKLDTNHE